MSLLSKRAYAPLKDAILQCEVGELLFEAQKGLSRRGAHDAVIDSKLDAVEHYMKPSGHMMQVSLATDSGQTVLQFKNFKTVVDGSCLSAIMDSASTLGQRADLTSGSMA